jgi:hypothetical protein
MSERKIYEVKPHQNGGWQGKLQSATRASVVADTKAEALAQTKELAKAATLGQVIVKGRDHVIQTEHTYGADPRRSVG